MKDNKMKQTEIGMIPDDWEVREIGEIADVIGGGTPSTEKKEYWNGKIQWFTPAEITNSDKYICTSVRTISTEGMNNSSAKLLPKGTILLTTRASIGNAAILLNEACTNQGFQSLVARNNIDTEYLYYLIPGIVPEMYSIASGSTFLEISSKKLKTIKIHLPSTLAEQKKIAQVLSDVDSVIATLEKLIAKKKNIKQGTMQLLLTGKKRLPGFAKSDKFKQTEIGLIPADWEVVSLNNLIEDISDGPFGSNLKTEHYTTEKEARIIQLSNVGEDGWNNENIKYTTFLHAKELSRCIVPYGAIVIAKMMPAGRAILCPNKEAMYILGSDCVKFIPNCLVDSKYFVYYTKCDAYLNQIKENTQGSTRARTSVTKLKKIGVVLPPKPEQTAIANVFSDMDREIEMLENKLAKYRDLKTGMMQQLLTGRIRLR